MEPLEPQKQHDEIVPELERLSFPDALRLVKAGNHTACRSGWNGKGMHIFLVDVDTAANRWDIEHPIYGFAPLRPFIAMYTANGEVVPWVASQSDLLAEDWAVHTF